MPERLPSISQQSEMAAMICQLAPHEGHTRTLLDGVRLMRADGALGRTPVLYEPGIVIVCQGHKRGYLADRVYHYDPLHYLVLSVPLPFSSETDASPAEPFLAVSIRLDMTAVADLVMAVDHHATASGSPVGIVSTPLDDTLADTTVRLLKVLFSPLEARVLGPGIVRELIFVCCWVNRAEPFVLRWPAMATLDVLHVRYGVSTSITPVHWMWLHLRTKLA